MVDFKQIIWLVAGGNEHMTNQNICEYDILPELSDCTLCPRECHVNRNAGEIGYCGQTAALTAARAALHFWEEPCLSGTNGSGAVFFSGCNLRCVYCQNHAIAGGFADGKSPCPVFVISFWNYRKKARTI